MKPKHFLYSLLFIFALILILPHFADAQCAMCKAVTKSNLENNEQSYGLGLNKGILYLLSVPFLLVVIMGYVFFKESILEWVNKKREMLKI